MKKLICVTGIILIACTVSSSMFSGSTDAATQTVQQSTEATVCEEDVFILKIEDGYLKVYRKDSGEIYMHTDTMSSNLPKSDVMLLEKGVEVKGKAALRKAVEDYCS